MSPDRDPNIWRTEPPSLVAGWLSWKQLQELEGPLVVVDPDEVAPEPPPGSVVLDVDGGAWQGFGHNWQDVGGGSMYNWQELNSLYGPLRIIYTAEPS